MTAEFIVEVRLSGLEDGARVLAPAGLASPHARPLEASVTGGRATVVHEAFTGQAALCITADAPEVILRTRFDTQPGHYPEAMFHPAPSRYTRAAGALLDQAADMAGTGDDLTRARRIACGVAERFDYGHPEARFNDGLDHVPALGCGLVSGSCVDINTYFLAALRAAGITAGYVAGPFYPAEKRDWCSDMHCWVVTRIGGATQEWDIAHHLKLGTRDIHPALNPKPGFRAALSHSMGLAFPGIGLREVKVLSAPFALRDGVADRLVPARIGLHYPALPA